MPTEAETDMTLIVASCKFANAPTNDDMARTFRSWRPSAKVISIAEALKLQQTWEHVWVQPQDIHINRCSSQDRFVYRSLLPPVTIYISTKTLRTVAQWLRCCATNRKVTGSIPDGVIEIFHWHNPSDRTMARVESASNRNEYQEYFLEVKTAGA